AQPDDALGADPLLFRKPGLERLGDVGKTARLAHAEEETGDDEPDQIPGPAGRGGEERPPEDDAGQDLPGADAVAQPAAGNFEQRVPDAEGGEDVAHLRRG